MEQKLDLSSGKKEDKNKEQKVTLFGILAATKGLLNPLNKNVELNKQEITILQSIDNSLQSIENSLQKMAVSMVAVSNNLLENARVLNELKDRVH